MSAASAVVAYLAPEMPALSATFVHEELHAVEARGVRVLPVSVRRPAAPAPGQEPLAARTLVLYDRGPLGLTLAGAACVPRAGLRALRALAWLAKDMTRTGLLRREAWKLAFQWLAGARLAKMLADVGCRHLHVHFAHVPAQIGMYASAFSGIPFTVTAHANDIFERGLLLPQKAQRAAKLLTISHFNATYLVSIGVAASRLEVVRCGVSFAPCQQLPRFESKPTYRIGTLGRLVEKKGIDDLIRVVALLRDMPSQIELSIAGDGPMREALQALAGELGVAHRVRFEGAMAHQAVGEWLRSLDVFVLACKRDAQGDQDGIPVVLMEAMSQGVPVLSTRLSGIPELVAHERTGLLANPGDPADLAAELQRLLEAPSLRALLARAALEHVGSEFGQALNVDRLLRHFAGLGTASQSSLPEVASIR